MEHGVGLKVKDPPIETPLPLELREVFYGGIKKIKIYREEFCDETRTKTELRDRILVVPIRPGIKTGCRILFPGEGDRGPTKIPGDIVFIVEDRLNDYFQRDGVHLYMEHQISLVKSLVGFVVEVNTIDNRRLMVPITDVVKYNTSL